MRKTIKTRRKVTNNPATKKTKPTFKTPTARYIKMPDGTKHMVIDLGYKTNALDMLREYCGRG